MTALVTLWAGGFLAMLDDGTRVISTRGMYRAIGAANAASSAVDKTPRFLRSKSLSPFVPAGFSLSTRMPLRYHLPGNNAMAPSRARARAEHATAAAYALNHIRHNHNPVDGDVVGAVVLDGERELLHAFDELH